MDQTQAPEITPEMLMQNPALLLSRNTEPGIPDFKAQIDRHRPVVSGEK